MANSKRSRNQRRSNDYKVIAEHDGLRLRMLGSSTYEGELRGPNGTIMKRRFTAGTLEQAKKIWMDFIEHQEEESVDTDEVATDIATGPVPLEDAKPQDGDSGATHRSAGRYTNEFKESVRKLWQERGQCRPYELTAVVDVPVSTLEKWIRIWKAMELDEDDASAPAQEEAAVVVTNDNPRVAITPHLGHPAMALLSDGREFGPFSSLEAAQVWVEHVNAGFRFVDFELTFKAVETDWKD